MLLAPRLVSPGTCPSWACRRRPRRPRRGRWRRRCLWGGVVGGRGGGWERARVSNNSRCFESLMLLSCGVENSVHAPICTGASSAAATSWKSGCSSSAAAISQSPIRVREGARRFSVRSALCVSRSLNRHARCERACCRACGPRARARRAGVAAGAIPRARRRKERGEDEREFGSRECRVGLGRVLSLSLWLLVSACVQVFSGDEHCVVVGSESGGEAGTCERASERGAPRAVVCAVRRAAWRREPEPEPRTARWNHVVRTCLSL